MIYSFFRSSKYSTHAEWSIVKLINFSFNNKFAILLGVKYSLVPFKDKSDIIPTLFPIYHKCKQDVTSSKCLNSQRNLLYLWLSFF